jgi:phage shock protein C
MPLRGRGPGIPLGAYGLHRWKASVRRRCFSYANDAGLAPENREDMSTAAHPQIDIHAGSLPGARAWFAAKGLTRPREGRILAGVSAGIARRYDLNRLVARLMVIAGILLLTPLAYVAAWILMPKDATAAKEAKSVA